MATVTEIKREPRNQETINTLEEALRMVRDNPDASEVFVLAKIGDDYHRLSSGITDLMQLVATLELAKFDALNRMT